jgi:hypothetical protein
MADVDATRAHLVSPQGLPAGVPLIGAGAPADTFCRRSREE